MDKEKKVNFKCRVCGCNEYREEFESNGILGPGGKTLRAACVCEGCSVVFRNPEKFSVKK